MLHRPLTLLLALQLALAPMARAGVTSTVSGEDFGDAFRGSFISSVVALGLADVHTGIGDVFADGANGGEGSLGHVLLHGLAGCAAAEAQGADCASGAMGGIAGAIYSGSLNGTSLSDAQQRQRAELIGAAVGWLFSGGSGANVSVAANVALSGIVNNRQMHRDLANVIYENAEAFAKQMGLCPQNICTAQALSTARGFLTAAAYDRDDAQVSMVIVRNDAVVAAREFLDRLTLNSSNPNIRPATEQERNDPTINLGESNDPLVQMLNTDVFTLQASGQFQVMGWDRAPISPTTILFYAAFNQGSGSLFDMPSEVIEYGLSMMSRDFSAYAELPSAGSMWQYVNAVVFIQMTNETNPALAQRYAQAFMGEGTRVSDLSILGAAGNALQTKAFADALANDYGNGPGRLNGQYTTRELPDGSVVAIGQNGEIYRSFDQLPDGALGPSRIVKGVLPDSADIARLNAIDPAVSRSKLHEAVAAAIMEKGLGLKLARSNVPNVDYVVIDGRFAGKTVDMMYTIDPSKPGSVKAYNDGLARRFNSANFDTSAQKNILEHLGKADLVPLDIRNLTPENQTTVRSFVRTLPTAEQARIIFLE